MRCANCGSTLVNRKRVEFKVYGISVGKFFAEACSKCGEEIFDETTSHKIDEAAKRQGLWGLETKGRIGKSGEGLVIRVNKKLSKFLDLEKGKEIVLVPESKHKLNILI